MLPWFRSILLIYSCVFPPYSSFCHCSQIMQEDHHRRLNYNLVLFTLLCCFCMSNGQIRGFFAIDHFAIQYICTWCSTSTMHQMSSTQIKYTRMSSSCMLGEEGKLKKQHAIHENISVISAKGKQDMFRICLSMWCSLELPLPEILLFTSLMPILFVPVLLCCTQVVRFLICQRLLLVATEADKWNWILNDNVYNIFNDAQWLKAQTDFWFH